MDATRVRMCKRQHGGVSRLFRPKQVKAPPDGSGGAFRFAAGRPRARAARRGSRLLDRDGGAGALEGSLGLVRGLLVDLLQYGLRRAVHQVLGLLEAQAGQRSHFLDDLDLLVASGFEDDVELVLLLGSL